MAGSGPTIQIPRWIQLVVLPVALLVAFLLASTLGHVLFLFLTASVIAFTLNPLVRDLTRLKVPRAPSVFVVYAIFLAVVAALLIAIGAVAVRPGAERGRPRRRVRHRGTSRATRPRPSWTSTGCRRGSTTTGSSRSRSASRSTTGWTG